MPMSRREFLQSAAGFTFPINFEGLPDRIADLWTPPERTSTWDWLKEHGVNELGAQFNCHDYPWCRGVCDAFDSGQYHRIVLQWAARVGKTFLCLSLLLKVMATDPQFMLFGTRDEKLLRRIYKTKIWRMLERGPLCDKLPPEGKRSSELIALNGAYLQGAWAGSDTRLADYGCAISHANEISKWPDSEDGGDTLDQFLTRSAEYPNRMNLVEGTPERAGICRVESQREQGTDCRYWVPCRKCGEYQVLGWGRGEIGEPGIFFSKPSSGPLDPDLAYRTAHYVCKCGAEHWDEHKPAMVRAGRWAPAGCRVDKSGTVVGTPRRPHARIWSSQLSALYALNRRWGDLAEKFCQAQRNLSKMQVFTNLFLGETFKTQGRTTTAEQLGLRLRTNRARKMVPSEATLLAMAVDVQRETYPWNIIAAGPDGRRWLVDYGEETSWEAVETALDETYQHEDGPEVNVSIALVDSGDGARTKEVYDWCQRHSSPSRPVLPVKGSSQDMPKPYRVSVLGNQRSSAARQHRGERLVIVHTDYWESDVDWRLFDGEPEEPEGLSLCKPASEDMDYLAQLLNATQKRQKDSRGREKILWVKDKEDEPNDFRDTLRYALCGCQLWLDDHRGRLPTLRKKSQQQQHKRRSSRPRFTTPDGRAFLVTERRYDG